ncbi:hypothetical protein HT576_16130 [Haloterrigena sp. SYSU A121-1]|uniref:DUF7344 domain-containing protein n=1 Tax=Haloterrigena gelatinilytica TaxID=2741724 RepID=A0A8J8GNN9_9EURY|nr:hypothetical protein [Haloterrigena gelatinilytica]NUB92538.1 hypothetical protein [Haloterrigena gelatinilytica]
MPVQPESLERETVYSLLADRVREYLLCHLATVDRTTVPDAAERLAVWSRATSELCARERDGIAIQLVHNHLPRLAEHDVVVYDRSSDAVATGPNFADLEPYVDPLEPPRV